MRISSFFYTLGQGFKNLVRNGWYTMASITTVTVCLFLFGMFYSVLINFQNIVSQAEEGVSITVFFKEGTTEDQMFALKSEIEKRSEVREIVYESADEAWEEFKVGYLGEYADGFPENPLEGESNLQIYLSDVSEQSVLVAYIESVSIVRSVNRSEIAANTLSSANKLVAMISMGLIALLIAVSVFLISNTVSVGINIRREEINIMKYIGATDFIVRAPFVIEGMIIGFIGSVLPLIIVYIIYNKSVTYMMERFSMLSNYFKFVPSSIFFDDLSIIMISLGVGIGLVGSFFTVRKHLHV